MKYGTNSLKKPWYRKRKSEKAAPKKSRKNPTKIDEKNSKNRKIAKILTKIEKKTVKSRRKQSKSEENSKNQENSKFSKKISKITEDYLLSRNITVVFPNTANFAKIAPRKIELGRIME